MIYEYLQIEECFCHIKYKIKSFNLVKKNQESKYEKENVIINVSNLIQDEILLLSVVIIIYCSNLKRIHNIIKFINSLIISFFGNSLVSDQVTLYNL